MMPDTTPNYGWRIPKADGTDYIIPDDVRLPVGSIDTQMKVEENARLANTNTLNGLGVWADVTGMVICTDTVLTAQAGSSISKATAMKIGKTVWYDGLGTTGSASAVCAVTLPLSLGTPKWRSFSCGIMYCTGASAPAGQMGVAIMIPASGMDRIVMISSNNAYITVPAAHGVRWGIRYEVN